MACESFSLWNSGLLPPIFCVTREYLSFWNDWIVKVAAIAGLEATYYSISYRSGLAFLRKKLRQTKKDAKAKDPIFTDTANKKTNSENAELLRQASNHIIKSMEDKIVKRMQKKIKRREGRLSIYKNITAHIMTGLSLYIALNVLSYEIWGLTINIPFLLPIIIFLYIVKLLLTGEAILMPIISFKFSFSKEMQNIEELVEEFRLGTKFIQ